jgi:hypothetical protein
MLVAGAATPAAHEQGDLCARAHGRHGSPTPDSAEMSVSSVRISMHWPTYLLTIGSIPSAVIGGFIYRLVGNQIAE